MQSEYWKSPGNLVLKNCTNLGFNHIETDLFRVIYLFFSKKVAALLVFRHLVLNLSFP